MPTSEPSSGYEVRPVGFVRSNPPEGPAEIVVYEEFSEALEGIERCEYIWILFWMHRLGKGGGSRCTPWGIGTGRSVGCSPSGAP